MLEIRLLGQVQVRDGGRTVELPRRKQRVLLAALALRVGDFVSPDRLVEDIWGESAPKTARHALENYVSELRKSLGRDAIRTGPAGYALDLPPDHVDATRFERLLRRARGQPAPERADAYRSALSLVRGPPLDDLAYEPLAQAAVPRLQELELTAREGLAEAELELGRHADVVLELEPLVASHPYRERLRAQLMLALYRSGRQADALASYQDGRRILVEELGIDPGEDLQALERAILRQDPELRAPPVSAPVSAPVAPETDDGGETARPARKTVAVLAVDLANATALAGALDPEPLRALLDRYHAASAAAVERHGGTGRRLDGEALLAVFGFPSGHEDDALRAVRAAVELRAAVGELNDGLFSEAGVFLEARASVANGEVLVTPDGVELATGRAVAEARSLAHAARSGQILVGESARALLRDSIATEPEPEAVADGAAAFRLVDLRPDAEGRLLRLDSPLVGRRRQLATLANAFEAAVAERALQLVTVLGPPGVGKSRLVRELADSVVDVASVLRGRCIPYGERDPLGPLRKALGLDDRAGGPEPARLGEEVRCALERLALDRPLVLVLEDLHWAEPPLLEMVREIADLSRGVSAVVVCTARPELLETAPSWGGGMPNAGSLLLEPLSEPEADRLIDNLLGDSELPDSVRDWIVRTADGNPLFLEELLAMLVDREILTQKAGRWTTTSVVAIPIPESIQVVVTSRIDRLPRDERLVLELASLQGSRSFGHEAVAELAPPDVQRAVSAHLASLVRKELIRPEPGSADRYVFRHQLVRDAAYSSMPMAARADLHERAAELAERTGADPDIVSLAAHHRQQAALYRGRLAARVRESADTT